MLLLHAADAIVRVAAVTVWPNLAFITQYDFSFWLFLWTNNLLNPCSVTSASTVCVSLTPSLTSWCFTNSWYTLPFPFLLFCRQKLHWWKLTCKVDSFVCLIQSLMSLPSLRLRCLCPPPKSLPPHSPHLPEQDDCLVRHSPTFHVEWASVS